MNKHEIERTIKQAVRKSQGKTTREWTEILNKEFIALAHSKPNYQIYTKTEGRDWGEWLYDITICKIDKTNEFIQETILVLESEWKSDSNSINEDFQKLLLCNSKYKVMVFCYNENVIPKLIKEIKMYKPINGTFILAFLKDDINIEFIYIK